MIGTSSLHEPTHSDFKLVGTTRVPVIRLADILHMIDWHRFPIIEQLKTDCQGHDLQVLRSAQHFLRERVVWVTPEVFCEGYKTDYSVDGKQGIRDGGHQLMKYLESQGFQLISAKQYPQLNGQEGFLNMRYKDIRNTVNVLAQGM